MYAALASVTDEDFGKFRRAKAFSRGCMAGPPVMVLIVYDTFSPYYFLSTSKLSKM